MGSGIKLAQPKVLIFVLEMLIVVKADIYEGVEKSISAQLVD